MKKIVLGLVSLLVCCMLAFTACGGDSQNSGSNGGEEKPVEPVYELTLDQTALNLELTHTARITATLKADGQAVDGIIEWSTDNAAVATVAGGEVTAQSVGTATVTATVNGKTAKCAVTVTKSFIPSLEIGVGNASAIAVLYEDSFMLKPYVVYDGNRFDDGKFSAVSANSEIVKVEENGSLTGVKVGETKVTVSGEWRGFGADVLEKVYNVRVSQDFSVSIDTPSVTKISSSAKNIAGYNVPNTVALTARVYLKGEEQNDSSAIRWVSSDKAVATVDGNGVVTGVAPGKTAISVIFTDSENVEYASVPVTVTVEYPCIDKTDSINLGELDASDAYDNTANGLVISRTAVGFADDEPVTAVFEVRGENLIEFATTSATNGDGVVKESGNMNMSAREQVWEIRNAEYGYRVKVFVISRIIKTADDLMKSFNIRTASSTDIKKYGNGMYYVLGNDIDATGTKRDEDSWTNDFKGSGGSGFMGEFDGKGNTVNGLTLQNGGLFGNLAPGSVIKNFALTNVTLTSSRKDYQPAPIAYSVYGDALIENVFIHITASPDEEANAKCGIRGFANMVRGNKGGTAPHLKSSVIFMDVGNVPAAKRAASVLTHFQSGNFSEFENVHVVSDYKFISAENGGDSPNPAMTGITRYGKGAANASFAAKYANAATALAEAGLSDEYWTYNADIGYPVFTSYKDAYLTQTIRAEFDKLPATVNLDAGKSYAVPSACGAVTLSLGSDLSGKLTVSGGAVSAAADIASGSATLTVTSKIDTGITKNITVSVRSASDTEKANLQEVFGKLNGKTYEFNVGKAGTWDLSKANIEGVTAADFGEVTMATSGDSLSGVTVNNASVTVAENATPGTVNVMVTSQKYADVSATVKITVLFKTTTVNALTEISKDSADNKNALDYSAFDEIKDKTVSEVSYRADVNAEFTAVAAEDLTFAAGKVTLSDSFISSLAKTGAYEFRVQFADAIAEFENVMVYTNIITTADELLQVFLNGKETQITYGEGEYYVLGNNINAENRTQVVGHYSDGGFKGTFDGKGYSIDKLTVQSGGLFGHLASGSTVKNFAMTNVIIGGNKWQPTVLATNVYTNATVENVFIHIAEVTSTSKATNKVRAFANLVRGNNNTTATMPIITNVVIVDASETKVNSFVEKIESGSDANFTNVHMIADSMLLGNMDTNEYFSGVTRYGAGAANASFAAAFAESSDVLASAKLSKDYWTYDAAIGYPVFTSSYSGFIEEIGDSVTIDNAIVLSKNVADNKNIIDFSENNEIGALTPTVVSYKIAGGTTYTTVQDDTVDVSEGKIVFGNEFVSALTTGDAMYQFRIVAGDKIINFTNVTVYTNIITTAEELKSVFGVRVSKSDGTTTNGTKFYGAGEYYVLGNNISVSGELRAEDNWSGNLASAGGAGFQGVFDGKGYTIDKLVLHNGGMFGNIAPGAIVRNFALTNITLNSARDDYQPASIAYFIYGNATVENVFVHIVSDTSEKPYVRGGSRGFANNFVVCNSNAPTVKDVVVFMDVGDKDSHAGSLVSTYGTDLRASFEDVHVISKHLLLNNQGTASDKSTVNYTGTVTRYESAEAFNSVHSSLESTGLSANCWTYPEGMWYPVFKTAESYLNAQ